MASDPDPDDCVANELRLVDRGFRHSADLLNGAGGLLDPAFVEFGSSGRVWEREAMLAAMIEDETASPEVRDMATTRLSPDVVLLTYRTVRDGRSTLRSSIWRRSTGTAWRLVFHQGTPEAVAPRP